MTNGIDLAVETRIRRRINRGTSMTVRNDRNLEVRRLRSPPSSVNRLRIDIDFSRDHLQLGKSLEIPKSHAASDESGTFQQRIV